MANFAGTDDETLSYELSGESTTGRPENQGPKTQSQKAKSWLRKKTNCLLRRPTDQSKAADNELQTNAPEEQSQSQPRWDRKAWLRKKRHAIMNKLKPIYPIYLEGTEEELKPLLPPKDRLKRRWETSQNKRPRGGQKNA